MERVAVCFIVILLFRKYSFVSSSYLIGIGPDRVANSFQNPDSISVPLKVRFPPENYGVHQPPPLYDGENPVPIQFSILIFGIFDVNELAGDISLEANLKIFWKDSRLANMTDQNIDVASGSNKYIVLNPSLINQIWTPDVFIDHMKSSSQPSLISKAASLRLFPDGSLRYSARILINLSCKMDFLYYPADTQKCSLNIKSYAYSNQTLTLAWKDNIGPMMAYPLDLHNFDAALETGPDYVQITRSASYSAISFKLFLRRKLSYHIIQTFIPSSLFTIVSWLSFLVPPEFVPGRMALTVTTLLTLTAMFSSVRQNTPNVSYVKYMDYWMLACIGFVFLTLVQYTTFLKLRSMKEKEKKRKESLGFELVSRKSKSEKTPSKTVKNWNNNNNNHAHVMDFVESTVAAPLLNDCTTTNINNSENKKGSPNSQSDESVPRRSSYDFASLLEKYTPRLLPVAFVLFNCIYWPHLLIQSDYYNLRHSQEMYYSLF